MTYFAEPIIRNASTFEKLRLHESRIAEERFVQRGLDSSPVLPVSTDARAKHAAVLCALQEDDGA